MMKWFRGIMFFLIGVCVQTSVLAVNTTNQLEASRILLFDDYALTNNTPPTWVHEGGLPVGLPATIGGLLAGTNHYHHSGWVLQNCRIGQRNYTGSMYVPPQMATNYIPTLSTTNYSAHLMNTLNAAIYSPVLTNGAGTLYFEAINSALVGVGVAPELSVDIATNMIGGAALSGSMANANVEWRWVFSTNLNATTTNDFVRVMEKLDIRQPVAIRIRRSAVNGTAPDNYYACVDNIRVSPAVPTLVFDAITSVVDSGGTFVACDISNVPGAYSPTDHTSRDVQLWYRWFSPTTTLSWNTLAMVYEPASGTGGDGEHWKATLAFVSGMALEYYFAYSGNPIYQSPDYTDKHYVYPPETDTRRYPEKHSMGRGRSMILLW